MVLAPIRDASDRVYRLVGIARDITQRKRAEKKLQETNQRLEDALAERRTLSTALQYDEIMTQIHTLLENAIDEVRDLAFQHHPLVTQQEHRSEREKHKRPPGR